MTDPFQPIDPQTQGQQTPQPTKSDDILGGEDIFQTIPEAVPTDDVPTDDVPTDDDLPYGDVLAKKYQFDPIPETLDEVPVTPISNTVADPAPVVEQVSVAPVVTQSKPIASEAVSEEPQVPPVSVVSQEIPQVSATISPTDIQKKFSELLGTIQHIGELKQTPQGFQVLGANNDKVHISYDFMWDVGNVSILTIIKNEQDKSTQEETTNHLKFSLDTERSSLGVIINDVLIFDEQDDLLEDTKKKMQVIDKLNKFIFLASEELRKIEQEIKEKEEAENERRRLQDIFRNF